MVKSHVGEGLWISSEFADRALISISPPCLGNRGQSDMCRADGGGKNRQTLMRLSFVLTLGNYGNETLMEKWQCGQEHVANSDKTTGNGVSI